MAHHEQTMWCLSMKKRFPADFFGVRVLDIGSLHLNGHNKMFFHGCDYTGLDLGEGPNVDVICLAHEYEPEEPFDTIISTSMLEHDIQYPETLRAMLRQCRPGGLIVFCCGSTGFKEHGTRSSHPKASPFTIAISDEWADYYKNLTEDDIREVWDCDAIFEEYEFTVGEDLCLRFWGRLKGDG